MVWSDSHCHLPADVDAARTVRAEARAAGVTRLVTVGCDQASTMQCIEAAAQGAAEGDEVWATVGLHPHDASHGTAWMAPLLDAQRALGSASRVIAVGECGLDYHYDHSPRDVQRSVFAEQVRFANERSLPLVIHTREAWDDTFAILHSEGTPSSTIFHCFTGGAADAERCLSLHEGVVLSFSGIVTFKAADDVRKAVALTPLHRMLVETDSPYLAPVPHRGKRNVPAWVVEVGTAIAAQRGLAVDEVAAVTHANTARAFGLGERVAS